MNERLDVYLVNNKYFDSRAKAARAIAGGAIEVDGSVATKAACVVGENSKIKILKETEKYVSRGGYKLEEAINKFNLDFKDKTVLDIGASTGGWTDCALQHGAKKVYAVDVGKGQLEPKIRAKKSVVSLENFNALNLGQEIFDECDFIVCDVSFTSGLKLFETLCEKIKNQKIVWLVKPQFECGKTLAKKHKGILPDKTSQEVAKDCINKATKQYLVEGFIESPIKGGDGNMEFLALMTKINKGSGL